MKGLAGNKNSEKKIKENGSLGASCGPRMKNIDVLRREEDLDKRALAEEVHLI